MSSQYDNIESEYSKQRDTCDAAVEKEKFRSKVTPFIRDAKVLELACGSGFYTFDLLEWGASSVVAVDISTAMISAAESSPKYEEQRSKVKFLVGDCSEVKRLDGAPFDLVVTTWLLNYASDSLAATQMFRNIAVNLKEGGHFVGIMCPPLTDVQAFVQAARSPDAEESDWDYDIVEQMEEGVKFRTYLPRSDQSQTAERQFFDSYNLKKAVYEASAESAGLTGVQWIDPILPGQVGKEDIYFAILVASA